MASATTPELGKGLVTPIVVAKTLWLRAHELRANRWVIKALSSLINDLGRLPPTGAGSPSLRWPDCDRLSNTMAAISFYPADGCLFAYSLSTRFWAPLTPDDDGPPPAGGGAVVVPFVTIWAAYRSPRLITVPPRGDADDAAVDVAVAAPVRAEYELETGNLFVLDIRIQSQSIETKSGEIPAPFYRGYSDDVDVDSAQEAAGFGTVTGYGLSYPNHLHQELVTIDSQHRVGAMLAVLAMTRHVASYGLGACTFADDGDLSSPAGFVAPVCSLTAILTPEAAVAFRTLGGGGWPVLDMLIGGALNSPAVLVAHPIGIDNGLGSLAGALGAEWKIRRSASDIFCPPAGLMYCGDQYDNVGEPLLDQLAGHDCFVVSGWDRQPVDDGGYRRPNVVAPRIIEELV